MPYISKSSIQDLINNLDANAVVGDYVRLEKRGGRLWACCPFHQEKTASFTVNPELKSYYCFGCHKGGTLINFVMEMDKISFPEAIEILAKKFGVKLVYDNLGSSFSNDDEEKKKKEELFELYRRISGTFHHFLLKNPEALPAKHYIISRGINNEMIERFGLGYAPRDRYWLYTFLSGKGYSSEFLAGSGLFSSKEKGVSEKRSSLFSGRLMFPINNQQGRTVAFGGRWLEENSGQKPESGGWEAPKYINSPELGIYKKRETLYALDIAMPELRRTKTAYLAEGYLDVLALHQAGITNALAPLGTAFTDEQAKLLKRWVERLIFFFDSDEAGQNAMHRGILTCRKNGLACAVVAETRNPSGSMMPTEAASLKDPADILLRLGPEALRNKAKCIIKDFDYLLDRAKSLYSDSGGKAKAVAMLFPYIELLDSEVERVSCFDLIADSFGLPGKAVTSDFYRQTLKEKPKNGKQDQYSHNQGEKVDKFITMTDELSLIITAALDYITSGNDKLISKMRSSFGLDEIEDYNAKELFVTLEECIRYEETSMDELLARISTMELKGFVLERSVSGEFSINRDLIIDDGIKKIKIKGLERRQEEITLKLRSLKTDSLKKNTQQKIPDSQTYELEANGLQVRELLSEKMQIDNELFQLKQGR